MNIVALRAALMEFQPPGKWLPRSLYQFTPLFSSVKDYFSLHYTAYRSGQKIQTKKLEKKTRPAIVSGVRAFFLCGSRQGFAEIATRISTHHESWINGAINPATRSFPLPTIARATPGSAHVPPTRLLMVQP